MLRRAAINTTDTDGEASEQRVRSYTLMQASTTNKTICIPIYNVVRLRISRVASVYLPQLDKITRIGP